MQKTKTTATPHQEDAQPWVGIKAPSPKNDVMHCPSYQPDAGPVLRPGALDYKRVASIGDRC